MATLLAWIGAECNDLSVSFVINPRCCFALLPKRSSAATCWAAPRFVGVDNLRIVSDQYDRPHAGRDLATVFVHANPVRDVALRHFYAASLLRCRTWATGTPLGLFGSDRDGASSSLLCIGQTASRCRLADASGYYWLLMRTLRKRNSSDEV